MPTLKYWDGSAWQYVVGTPNVPIFRQLVYSTDLPAVINVNSTAYGPFVGPTADFYVGPNGAALIQFYAQTFVQGGGDLIVTYSVTRVSDGVSLIDASDNNCLYVAPSNPSDTWAQGPGHVSGIMVAVGLPYNVACRCHIHYRVSGGTAQVQRRRVAVIPHQLTA